MLESEYGLELPRRLQIEFSQVVQAAMDASGKEFSAHDIFDVFQSEYRFAATAPVYTVSQAKSHGDAATEVNAEVVLDSMPATVTGMGNGPIDAFVNGLTRALGEGIRVLDYHEHSIGSGSDAQAVCYMELRIGEKTFFGVGTDSNIVTASVKAIVSGVTRARVSSLSFHAQK